MAEPLSSRLEFRLANDKATEGWQKLSVRDSDVPLFVSKQVCLHGGHVEKVSFFKDATGHPAIGLVLTDEGAKIMKQTTSANLQRKIAILLDGKVVSAPKIQSTIAKQVQITGSFGKDDLLAFFQAIVLSDLPDQPR